MSQPATPKKDRKPKVHWSAQELKIIIDAAVLASLEDTNYVWAYLAEGQKALPPNRQRLISGRHVVTREILAAFEKARRTLINTGVPAEVPTQVPVPVEQNRAQLLDSLTNEELVQLAVKRLAPLIEGLRVLGEAGGKKEHAPGPHPVPTPAASPAQITTTPALTNPPKPPKPTVVFLFGFTPEQEVDIKRRAGGFNLKLLFARQERGDDPPGVPVCDWCIVADSLTRRMQKALKPRVDDKHTFYIRSVSTTLQKLADLNSLVK